MTQDQTKKRLYDWGDWIRKHRDAAWSSENTIYAIMTDKVSAGYDRGHTEIYISNQVQQVEDAILSMQVFFSERKYKQIKRAFKIKFVAQVPDVEGYKRCKCSHSEYRNRLEKGINYIGGKIN